MSAHLSDEAIDSIVRDAGTAEQLAHLQQCAECKQGVAGAKGLARMLGSVRPYTLSEIAFRRVEAKLMEQAEAGLSPSWLSWLKLGVPLAVVLTTAVIAWAPGSEPTVREQPVLTAVTVSRPAPKPFPAMTATFTAGELQARLGEGAWKSFRAGDELKSGSALAGGRALLATSGEPRVVLEAEGSLAVGGQAMVMLGAGAAGVTGNSEVLAGTRRVMGVEATYRVERTAADVVVEVTAGAVEVFDESTTRRRQLQSPIRIRWADGTALETGVQEPITGWKLASAPRAPTTSLDLSGLVDGTLISVDGQEYGRAPMTLLLPVGKHTLQVTPPGGRMTERAIDLVAGQVYRFSLAERFADSPEPDPKALAQVLADIKRQTPKLRSCYEKWLKANPSAAGSVDLVLTVDAKGRVVRASVKGDPISPESVACLKTTAKTLVLPPLGTEEELEVPLVLTPGSH